LRDKPDKPDSTVDDDVTGDVSHNLLIIHP